MHLEEGKKSVPVMVDAIGTVDAKSFNQDGVEAFRSSIALRIVRRRMLDFDLQDVEKFSPKGRREDFCII